MKPPTDCTPPAWALSLMNPTEPPAWAQALISPLVTSVTEIQTAVRQNTASISNLQDSMKAEMSKIISPLSEEIAKVDRARSDDKDEHDKNIKELAGNVENKMEIMKAEHAAKASEILEKVDLLQKLVIDKSSSTSHSWSDTVSSSIALPVPRPEPNFPANDGDAPNPEKVESIMNEAKTILSLQPITNEDIEALMEEMNLEKDAATIEYVYEFLEGELGVENVKSEVEVVQFFRPARLDTKREQDRLYVQFVNSEEVSKIFLHVKKISNPEVKIMPYIPPSFSKRFRRMGDVAHSLRHSSMPVKTSIRWGKNDLVLQQKKPDSRFWETVLIPDLPLVELNPLPPASNPSSSPAPGLKRKKRKRSSHGNSSPDKPETKTRKNENADTSEEKDTPKEHFKSKKDHFEKISTPRPSMGKQRSSSSSCLPLMKNQRDIRTSLLGKQPLEN